MDLFYLMKRDSLKKKNRWPMHSAPRLPSTKVEAEEDEVEEEEAEGLQLRSTEPIIVNNTQII